MNSRVKRLRNDRDKLTGLKTNKITPRHTLKMKGNMEIQEDLYWRNYKNE